jgi:hypothetical protein
MNLLSSVVTLLEVEYLYAHVSLKNSEQKHNIKLLGKRVGNYDYFDSSLNSGKFSAFHIRHFLFTSVVSTAILR